jgi:transposase InsO family protein
MSIEFDSGYVWNGVVIAVLDLGDDLLLNASFAGECVINGPQRSLQLPDGSVVSMASKSIRTYDDERNVVCNAMPLTVTAGQAMLVCGKLSHSDYDGAELDMVGSVFGKCTIAGGRSDVVDGRVFLSLFNSSDTDVEVPAGTVLSMVCSVRHSIAELASDSLAPPSRQQQSEPTPMTTVVLKNKKGVDIKVQVASKHVDILRPVLQKNVDVFAHDGNDLGLVEGYTLSIPTIPGQRPIVCRERPLNPRQMEVADEKVAEQLERGIIESSMSPWNAALLLARQPSQASGYRFCIDYRRLNEATIPVNTALPNMNVIVRDLAGKKFYSTVDVKSAYNCLLIEPKDRDKTAFSHRGQKYRYLRAPFGLKGMPAVWQRVMTDVVGSDAQVFIDDCAMADNNIEEHAKRLDRVLGKLLKAGIKLSAKKCEFGTSMVKYLGYIVDARGINVDTGRYDDFFDKPDPTNRKELKSGLAFFSVYRKFIKNFALRIACFKRFDKEGQTAESKGSARTAVVFSDTDRQVWNDLKKDLKSRVSLAVPDFQRSFSIAVDASNDAWGAVLFQQPDRAPVMFASGQFNKSQHNYSATEKELAGLVNALDHFETFLIPGQEVVVYTDHKALQYLSTFKTKNSRLNRWSMALAEYDCKIVHVAGSKHADADYLSRPPFPSRYDQALMMTGQVPVAGCSAVDTSVKAQGNAGHTDGIGESEKQMAADFGVALRYMQCGSAASVSVVTRGSSKENDDERDKPADAEVLPPLVKLDKFVEAPRQVKITKLLELARATEHADATTLDMAKKLASAEAQVTPNYRVKLSQEIMRLQYQDPHLRNVADWLVNGDKAKGYSSWSKAYQKAMKFYRFGRRRDPVQRADGKRCKALSARILREVITTKKSALKSRWVVAVPFALRDYMLYQYHDSAGAGHLGIHATLARLAGKFHWPGMYADIVNHVKSCESCQQRKGSPSLHNIPKGQIMASHFNHLVCVDVTHPGQQHSRQAKVVAIGKAYDTRPEHGSKARNTRGILTITDVWSRYTVLVAIHNEQADTFVDAFYNAWIKYFGAPRRLLSDNGSNFVAQSTKEQLASWGIVPEYITPRNPQANGIAERINRPIMSALSALCGEGDDWHNYIPYVQLMLNTRVHSLLGVTPLEALCGHSTLFPEELECSGQEQSLDQHLRRLRTIRRSINKVYARKRRDLRRLRRNVKVPLTFEAGEKVMLYVKRKDHHKRSVRWDGPWTVSGLVNQPDDPNQFPLVYKICKFGQGGEVTATALGHINKLKPYHERA